jgi:hypothetical protein
MKFSKEEIIDSLLSEKAAAKLVKTINDSFPPGTFVKMRYSNSIGDLSWTFGWVQGKMNSYSMTVTIKIINPYALDVKKELTVRYQSFEIAELIIETATKEEFRSFYVKRFENDIKHNKENFMLARKSLKNSVMRLKVLKSKCFDLIEDVQKVKLS